MTVAYNKALFTRPMHCNSDNKQAQKELNNNLIAHANFDYSICCSASL